MFFEQNEKHRSTVHVYSATKSSTKNGSILYFAPTSDCMCLKVEFF